ncbi:cation:proton antiporter [Thiomicrospira microaerophila]|uniref:cation:proton antiporter n=1 Tax=Thiomicrospira microaerophila TaxID=406020 RepID=UPI001E55696E|nr:monovalent cation/H(+) antiporter subunit G [Thiomicrospira microaerophila]
MTMLFHALIDALNWVWISQFLSVLFISVGAVFFVAGTVGVLRFDSALNRLHALTKADNLGLGFVILGVMLQADSWALVLKYVMIWGLVLVSAAVVSHLMGQRAYQLEQQDADEQDARKQDAPTSSADSIASTEQGDKAC